MRGAIIGFVTGCWLLQQQGSLPSTWQLVLCAAVAMLVAVLARKQTFAILKAILQTLAGIGFGFGWAAILAYAALSHALPHELEGQDLTLVGTVDSLPDISERGAHFNFAVERVLVPYGAEVPPRLALSWYSDGRHEQAAPTPVLRPGERWRLTVRLRKPHGNANPDGFDYEVWLLEQRLRATGSVRPEAPAKFENVRLNEFVFNPSNVVERSRGWLRDRIQSALSGKPYAGVIVALVIGDQRAVSQSDWKVFNRTGIGHLVSISGLHITMVAGMLAALVAALWRRSFFTRAGLPLLLPTQKVAAIAGAAAALVYVLLAGFGVPAQRTLYMLTVVALALWHGRITSVSHVLCLALGVVVLLDPWAVLWPGFWLSFGAVATILYASVGRVAYHRHGEDSRAQRWRLALLAASHTQYVVTLGLVPLTMLLFAQISLVSPVANALAIPLVSFLVTPLALLGSIAPGPLSGWLLLTAHFLVEQLAALLQWLSNLPAAVWAAPLPSWWMFAAASLGILWLLAPRGWPARWLGVAGLVPLALNVPSHPVPGQMWVTAFDIGQGTALLIETPHRRLLYDTGPAYSPESDAGSRVILPYLKTRGIEHLDAVIVSHSDADHSGGALSILETVPVDWVSSSLPLDHAIVTAAHEHRRCIAGQAWDWDGIHFEMLHPTAVSYDSAKWKPNARSCTLKISLGDQSILLTGDIEAVQEAELIEHDPSALGATILLAPHHGSGTSSTLPFLQAVHPRAALFQVGYRNRYHHPKTEVFERYGDLGIRRIRSDESGAVDLRFGPEVTITEYRRDHARYWYGR